ncbi:FAD-dependent oxidoreductase [Actinosynnema sp. NPDC047251]|uniref:Amine oxidase n=1 Tax=Saccharothrix espanaensis (strain ATCC 51144 / DSM 44229 / JCM 9112 / NBRC 15066 / NRRL 15764) TaxID=1179773 RepID=K0JZF4_SACES|nr:FAD-dependent oxidoreductase [Saccharothrix espanaensis]CCH30657.1 Amine oxidase [Saccharothrix espanaensis DSM 44229]
MTRSTAAVVGSGVAGLTAAYLLQKQFDVTLFEADSRLGGHVDTREVDIAGRKLLAEAGFLIYNERTSPGLKRLFAELGVTGQPAALTTDVTCADCGFVHAANPLGTDTTPDRPENIDADTWKRFLDDIARFSAALQEMATSGKETTLVIGELLEQGGFSEYFVRHFLYPRTGSWFVSGYRALEVLPVQFVVNTFKNQGLLEPDPFSSWRMVSEGGREYVRRIAEQLTSVRTATSVNSIRRSDLGIEIHDAAGGSHRFDKAVIATHASQARKILVDATAPERELLGSVQYTPIEVLVHTDTTVLRNDRVGTSPLNVRVSCLTHRTSMDHFHVDVAAVSSLDVPERVLVSYNSVDLIAPERILARASYEHPRFDAINFAAQHRLADLSGPTLAFAGSYFGSGFHEDGCDSAIRAVAALGVTW